MIIGIILLVIALAELGLGLKFLFSSQRNQTTIFYGLFAIGSAVYVSSNGFGYLGWPFNPQLAESFGWAGGALATIFFLPFSFSFPIPRRTFRELWVLVVWPLLIFIPGFIFTDLLVRHRGVIAFGQGYKTDTGPYMWVFLLFIAVYWLWSICNFVLSYRKTDGIHRSQMRIILFGTLVSVTGTLIMDVYEPLRHVSHYGYVGSLLTAFWLGSSAYILLKK